MEIDPNGWSQSRLIEAPVLLGKYDEAIAASNRFDKSGQDLTVLAFLWKNDLDQAKRAIEQELATNPDEPFARSARALLHAMKGEFLQSESARPPIGDSPRCRRQ